MSRYGHLRSAPVMVSCDIRTELEPLPCNLVLSPLAMGGDSSVACSQQHVRQNGGGVLDFHAESYCRSNLAVSGCSGGCGDFAFSRVYALDNRAWCDLTSTILVDTWDPFDFHHFFACQGCPRRCASLTWNQDPLRATAPFNSLCSRAARQVALWVIVMCFRTDFDGSYTLVSWLLRDGRRAS